MERPAAPDDLPTGSRNSRPPSPRLRAGGPFGFALPLLALLTATALVYWRVLNYPFIQDDWGHLSALVNGDHSTYLADALSMRGKLFYRPVSLLYFMLYNKIFGLNPLPFHVVGLIVLTLNSLLVVFIALKLTGNHSMSWVAGLVYSAALTVHLDPLLWLVGFYDLSASFFYLASLALFSANRKWHSSMIFALAILAKESTMVLAFVFVLFVAYDTGPVRRLPYAIWRRLWPHFLILSAYLLARSIAAPSPFSLPAGEPYRMQLLGIHIFKNLFRYAWWGLEAVSPFRNLSSGSARWALWMAFLCAVFLYSLKWKPATTSIFPPRWTGFLACWAGFGVIPALLLPNHSYKYYLLYSLPPLVLIWLSFLCRISCPVFHSAGNDRATLVVRPPHAVVRRPGSSPCLADSAARMQPTTPPVASVLFVALVLVNIASAAWHFTMRDRAGVNDAYTFGTNHLIHRGHAARLVLDYLAQAHPAVPGGSVFLLGGFDPQALGDADAFRAFYGDETIRAFRLSDMESVAGGRYIRKKISPGGREDPHASEVRIEPGALFCLTIKDGIVREEDPRRAIEHE